MPRLSCIISVVGSAQGLEATLLSVLEHRPADCEILVVLGAAYDDPYDLKNELRFLDAPLASDYVACANLGIEASSAPIVHLLAAGMQATEGWADAAMSHFSDPDVAAVTPAVRDAAHRDSPLPNGVACSRGGRPLPRPTRAASANGAADDPFPSVRAAFYRRDALQLLTDGLPSMLCDELAGVDLSLGLQFAGYRAALEPACEILTSAKPAPSRGYRYGLAAERLFWRNLPAQSLLGSLAMHPLTVAGELLRSLPTGAAFAQLLGRIVATCAAGSYPAHHQRLRAALADRLRQIDAEAAAAILPHRPRSDDRPSASDDVRLRRA